MAMSPRLLRPKAAGNTVPQFTTQGYARVWGVTTKSTGNVAGTAETDTGYYAVKWWDNTTTVYDSGDPFSKAAAGNQRAFEVYPCDAGGVASGQFDGFDISNNALTRVRSEGVTLADEVAGSYNYTNYSYVSASPAESATLSGNLLSAAALNEFYTDLDAGGGDIFVSGNPGIDADTPTIATAKGYTVFGSVPPETALLLNFNSSLSDSSPSGISLTNSGTSFDTTQKKYGSASLSLDGGYLVSGAGDIPDLSQDDFTIEAWVFRPEGIGNACVVHLYGGGTGGSIIWIDDNNTIYFDDAATAGATATDCPTGQWVHIAGVRHNGTSTVYMDGVASPSTSAVGAAAGPYTAKIGAYGPSDIFDSNMLIDDLRITVSAALYTANFTPPTAQLGVYP
jgi:hypothetical protein